MRGIDTRKYRYAEIDSKSLHRYFDELAKISEIDEEKEVELVKKAQAGDIRARNELIKVNLKFVVLVAKQYTGKNGKLSDLVSAGNMGLIRAIDKYDHTRGYKFISYAVWWIRQNIHEFINNNSKPVRIPSNKSQSITKIARIRKAIYEEEGRPATMDEIINESDLTIDEVRHTIKLMQDPIYIDEETGTDEDDGYTYKDVLKGLRTEMRTGINDKDMKVAIHSYLRLLDERSRDMISMRYGVGEYKHPHDLTQISKKIGITKERCRQIIKKAIERLRRIDTNRDTLRQYM